MVANCQSTPLNKDCGTGIPACHDDLEGHPPCPGVARTAKPDFPRRHSQYTAVFRCVRGGQPGKLAPLQVLQPKYEMPIRVKEFPSGKAGRLGWRDRRRVTLLTPEVCWLLGPEEKRIRLRSYHIPTRSIHLNNVPGLHQDHSGVFTLALTVDPDFVLPRSAR